ncbi:MAG TPA: HAMP domain-containing sensor histidine kinase [Thermoanaerobaculia bacterium]|jgi:signal transduction histidine kinase
MLRELFARLTAASRRGSRPDRARILLPFLIISVGLGALAWRSYQLSLQMEIGAKTLAVQYSGYAAEITARRVDAAVVSRLNAVSEEWQQTERRIGEPTFSTVRDWLGRHDWIVSAIYVPDFDPASSIYVTELAEKNNPRPTVRGEFYSPTGTVRYAYNPDRLLALVHGAVRQQPLVTSKEEDILQQRADVSLVRDVRAGGLTRLEDGFSFVEPLGAPLQNYGVRAVVRSGYFGSGWRNQRVMNLFVSIVALLLTSVGTYLAMRGVAKEAETTKLRGALIANVSHELRTPLSMIRLGAETLMRGKLKEKERLEIQDQILREVLLLSHLVENVLDVARIQNQNARAMAFTPVHPRDLIRNLITTYESWIRSKGFTVEIEVDEAVGEQYWDRDAVSRALLNLIDNAIKYSREDDRRIDVVLYQNPEHVVLEVRDRGIGISQKDLAKIFDPYFRAQFSDTITRRGAGLGLTLVQQIASSHGGKIEVESEPGQGSVFRMLFPRDLAHDSAGMPSLAHTGEAF